MNLYPILKRSKLPALFVLMIFLSLASAKSQQSTTLKILISGKPLKELTLKEMKDKLEVKTVSFHDPSYSKEKNYRAFRLSDFLDLAYGSKWKTGKYSDISFLAYDGYDAVSDISKLKQQGGYLVFQDIDFPNWEIIDNGKSYPGPFYIVWVNKNQNATAGYPWPWQLESVNLITFADEFPEIVPAGADKNSSTYRGYEIFKARCARCHSINRQGGKIGPDLNAPKNILEYRPVDVVKEFIKNPSMYRFGQMPDNKDLSDKELDNLIDYFIYNMKENRWSFEENN